jgi:uncharacterized protein (TIGR03083 family)
MNLGHGEVSELLGAYALASCSAEETAAIVTHLDDCEACATEAARLSDAASLLAASSDRRPPSGLRARVVQVARARRAPSPTAVLAYAGQTSALLRLLMSLRPDQWSVPALGEWTVQDLVAHLASTETLFAVTLGLIDADPIAGERDLDRRTAAAIHDHRTRRPAETVAEWRRAVDLVRGHVSAPSAALDRRIEWVGTTVPVDRVLLSRSFEIWIHADDVRRALGRPGEPPPPTYMRAVADLAVRSLPAALRAIGLDHMGRSATVVLTGPGGGEWSLSLGAATSAEPDTVLRADVVDFCLLAGGRLRVEELDYDAAGDVCLAADLVRAAPAFAGA